MLDGKGQRVGSVRINSGSKAACDASFKPNKANSELQKVMSGCPALIQGMRGVGHG